MLVKYEIYNHSGTMLDNFKVNSDIIPRAGEIVVLDEMDNTTEFIVTDILHYPKDNFVTIKCESFYRQGGENRYFYLLQENWLPPCLESLYNIQEKIKHHK